jgi:hypothetical protein
MSGNDDDTLKKIRDLCAHIVNIDEITRDKVKGAGLVGEVKERALGFRAQT